jgi:Uma2 family endonuclease
MSAHTLPRATLDDLMKVDGKAELINGRIVRFMPSGFFPVHVARRITRSLEDYATASGQGVSVPDLTAYGFNSPLPSGRQSLCPDSSYYTGVLPPKHMGYIDGYPIFAIEVRSENDYGPAKEREQAEKRTDYFAAGTLVVWDVDPVAETVTVYTSTNPQTPTFFRRGDTADAEPAVPGWRLSVDSLFA